MGQTIYPMSNSYLTFRPKGNTVKFRVEGYKKSSKFDISTVGLSGSFELDKMTNDKGQPNQFFISDRLEYGIQIRSAEIPFNKTTLITVAPRYLLVNKLKKPIVIK